MGPGRRKSPPLPHSTKQATVAWFISISVSFQHQGERAAKS
jgi:hypothetical protein